MNIFDRELATLGKADTKAAELSLKSPLKSHELDPNNPDWQTVEYTPEFLKDPDSPMVGNQEGRLTGGPGVYPDAPEQEGALRYSGHPNEEGIVTPEAKKKAEAIRAQHASNFKKEFGHEPTDEDLYMWERDQQRSAQNFFERAGGTAQVQFRGTDKHDRPLMDVRNAAGESLAEEQAGIGKNAAWNSPWNFAQKRKDILSGEVARRDAGSTQRKITTIAGDLAKTALGTAAVSTVKTLVEAGDAIGLFSQGMADWGREKYGDLDDWVESKKSLQLDKIKERYEAFAAMRERDKPYRIQKLIDEGHSPKKAEALDALSDIGNYLKMMLKNPAIAADSTAQVFGFLLPSVVGGVVVGALAKGAVVAKGGQLTPEVMSKINKLRAATGIGVGALQEGAGSAGELHEKLMETDFHTLEKNSKVYREFLEKFGGDKEKARRATADEESSKIFAITAGFIGATSTAFNKFGFDLDAIVARGRAVQTVKKPLSGSGKDAAKRIFGTTAKTTAGNIVEEGVVQEPGGQVIENIFERRNINPEEYITRGVGRAAAEGAIGGMGSAGAISGISQTGKELGRAVRGRPNTPMAQAIDEGIDKAAEKHNLPEVASAYLRAITDIESGWGTNNVGKAIGHEISGDKAQTGQRATGPFQFMPGTARELGLTNTMDPEASADAAARYLKQNYEAIKKRHPNISEQEAWHRAALAHHSGLGNVLKAEPTQAQHFGKNNVKFNNPDQEAGMQPQVREALGSIGMDITITSGHRTEEHNAKVGGAKGSRHVHGDAADISMAGMDDNTKKEMVRRLFANGFNRFITYDKHGHLHVDMHGSKPAFMHNSSAKNLANAPQWLKEVMAEVEGGQVQRGSTGNLNLGKWGRDYDQKLQQRMGRYSGEKGVVDKAVEGTVGKAKKWYESKQKEVEEGQESPNVTVTDIKEARQRKQNTVLSSSEVDSTLKDVYSRFEKEGVVTADDAIRHQQATKLKIESLLKTDPNSPEIATLMEQSNELLRATTQADVAATVRRFSPTTFDTGEPADKQAVDDVADLVREGIYSLDQLKEIGLPENVGKEIQAVLEGAEAQRSYEQGRTVKEKFGRGEGSKGKGVAEHSADITEAIQAAEADPNNKTRKAVLDALGQYARFEGTQQQKEANYQQALDTYDRTGQFSPDELKGLGYKTQPKTAQHAENLANSMRKNLADIKKENKLMDQVLEGHLARSYPVVKEGFKNLEGQVKAEAWKDGIPNEKQFREFIEERGGGLKKSAEQYRNIRKNIQEALDFDLTKANKGEIDSQKGVLEAYLRSPEEGGLKELLYDPELKKQMEQKLKELEEASKKKAKGPTPPSGEGGPPTGEPPSPTGEPPPPPTGEPPTPSGGPPTPSTELPVGDNKEAIASIRKVAGMFLKALDQKDSVAAVDKLIKGPLKSFIPALNEAVKAGKVDKGIRGIYRSISTEIGKVADLKGYDLTKNNLKTAIQVKLKELDKFSEEGPKDIVGTFDGHVITFVPEKDKRLSLGEGKGFAIAMNTKDGIFVQQKITKEQLDEYLGGHGEASKSQSSAQKQVVAFRMKEKHGVDLNAIIADMDLNTAKQFVVHHEIAHVINKDRTSGNYYSDTNQTIATAATLADPDNPYLADSAIKIEARANQYALKKLGLWNPVAPPPTREAVEASKSEIENGQLELDSIDEALAMFDEPC